MKSKSKRLTRKMLLPIFLISVCVLTQLSQPTFALTAIEVTISPNKVIGNNNFSLGFQLHGPDMSIWRDRSVLRSLAQEANFKLIRIHSYLLEPCKNWNESTKTGKWYWSNVDLLIQRIFEIGAEPLIVLGFYSWTQNCIVTPLGMAKNPKTGLPYPESWAAYCAEWVKHLREAGFPVRYYEMVNEPIFYFGWDANLTKLGYFVDLYNAAARAMRNVNPSVKLGCDATIMKKVLDYFISYGENLDFLSYHGYGTGDLKASDAEILNAAETIYIGETKNVYGVEKARQLYKAARGIDLPVFKTENNINYHYTQGTDPRIQKMLGVVYNALTFRIFILKGFAYNVYFHFASSASKEQQKPSGGLGFGMINSDNDQPWYPYYVHKMVGTNLAVGDPIVGADSASDDIRVVAWIHGKKLNILIICKVDEQRTLQLKGVSGQLSYSRIDNSISWKTPAVQTGTVNPAYPITLKGYTVMLLQGATSDSTTQITTSSFADDFESGDFGAWTGIVQSSGETAKVVNYKPYQGTYHARFTTSGSGGTENAYCYKKINEEELYVRGYFYIASGVPLTDNGDQFYFLRLALNGQSLAAVGIRRRNGVDNWMILARNGAGWAGPVYDTSTGVQKYRWYSIEIYWKKSTSNGAVAMYLNGKKILEITNINTAYLGDVNEIDFGIVSATNIQNQLIVYGDCLKTSKTYIGP